MEDARSQADDRYSWRFTRFTSTWKLTLDFRLEDGRRPPTTPPTANHTPKVSRSALPLPRRSSLDCHNRHHLPAICFIEIRLQPHRLRLEILYFVSTVDCILCWHYHMWVQTKDDHKEGKELFRRADSLQMNRNSLCLLLLTAVPWKRQGDQSNIQQMKIHISTWQHSSSWWRRSYLQSLVVCKVDECWIYIRRMCREDYLAFTRDDWFGSKLHSNFSFLHVALLLLSVAC